MSSSRCSPQATPRPRVRTPEASNRLTDRLVQVDHSRTTAVPGTKQRVACAERRGPGMVRAGTRGRTCKGGGLEGCFIKPTFGVPGTTSTLTCAGHHGPGMVRVTGGKTCTAEGCSKRPRTPRKSCRCFARDAEGSPGMVSLEKDPTGGAPAASPEAAPSPTGGYARAAPAASPARRPAGGGGAATDTPVRGSGSRCRPLSGEEADGGEGVSATRNRITWL